MIWMVWIRSRYLLTQVLKTVCLRTNSFHSFRKQCKSRLLTSPNSNNTTLLTTTKEISRHTTPKHRYKQHRLEASQKGAHANPSTRAARQRLSWIRSEQWYLKIYLTKLSQPDQICLQQIAVQDDLKISQSKKKQMSNSSKRSNIKSSNSYNLWNRCLFQWERTKWITQDLIRDLKSWSITMSKTKCSSLLQLI